MGYEWDEGKEEVVVDGLMLYLVTGSSLGDGAVLVGPPDCDEREKVWVPKSQILDSDLDYLSDEGLYTEGYITIPRWLAEDRRLI